MVVFTDLDGTLLDDKTYSFDAAREALDELRARAIPLILVSSKTRAEIEAIRLQLHNDHPFIVENGGAIVIPKGYFPFPLPDAISRSGYDFVEMGTPYDKLRVALKEIQQAIGKELRGYGDMSAEEIAERTGLSLEEARLSKKREYDEPFLADGLHEGLVAAITTRGLCHTKGDRFHHLMGPHDKGRAVRYLIECYRRRTGHDKGALLSVALGNSANDLPMLEAVDRPILVQLPDGSFQPGIATPRLTRAPAPGPVGWNLAMRAFLQ